MRDTLSRSHRWVNRLQLSLASQANDGWNTKARPFRFFYSAVWCCESVCDLSAFKPLSGNLMRCSSETVAGSKVKPSDLIIAPHLMILLLIVSQTALFTSDAGEYDSLIPTPVVCSILWLSIAMVTPASPASNHRFIMEVPIPSLWQWDHK